MLHAGLTKLVDAMQDLSLTACLFLFVPSGSHFKCLEHAHTRHMHLRVLTLQLDKVLIIVSAWSSPYTKATDLTVLLRVQSANTITLDNIVAHLREHSHWSDM